MLGDSLKEAVEVAQVDFHGFVQKAMGTLGFARKKHKEIVVSVEALAEFEEASAEQADDGALRLLPQLASALTEERRTIGPGSDWSGRRGHCRPHAFGQLIFEAIGVLVVKEGVVDLFKVPNALGHSGDGPAGDAGTQEPISVLTLGFGPNRHQARRAVGQHPIRPPFVLMSEGAAEFDGIDMEPLKDILVDDGELLDGVIDTDRPFGQSEVIAQSCVGHGGDAGGAVAGEVDGHAVGLLVVEGAEDAFARSHDFAVW